MWPQLSRCLHRDEGCRRFHRPALAGFGLALDRHTKIVSCLRAPCVRLCLSQTRLFTITILRVFSLLLFSHARKLLTTWLPVRVIDCACAGNVPFRRGYCLQNVRGVDGPPLKKKLRQTLSNSACAAERISPLQMSLSLWGTGTLTVCSSSHLWCQTYQNQLLPDINWPPLFSLAATKASPERQLVERRRPRSAHRSCPKLALVGQFLNSSTRSSVIREWASMICSSIRCTRSCGTNLTISCCHQQPERVCTIPRARSCHHALRFVARQNYQCQIPLVALVMYVLHIDGTNWCLTKDAI